jgi:hypothetical protein
MAEARNPGRLPALLGQRVLAHQKQKVGLCLGLSRERPEKPCRSFSCWPWTLSICPVIGVDTPSSTRFRLYSIPACDGKLPNLDPIDRHRTCSGMSHYCLRRDEVLRRQPTKTDLGRKETFPLCETHAHPLSPRGLTLMHSISTPILAPPSH